VQCHVPFTFSKTENQLINRSITLIGIVFTARRYALRGLSYRNSVCLYVCLSVCPSVTLVDCVHMVLPTIMISSPYGSLIILVFWRYHVHPQIRRGSPRAGALNEGVVGTNWRFDTIPAVTDGQTARQTRRCRKNPLYA